MFRGFQNFVNDLEASARQNSVNQTGQPQVVSPPASARGSPGPQSPTNSNAQLAENALSGLRKSFRGSGVGRPSQDSPRTGSADWGRWGSRPSSPAQPPNKPKIPIPVEKHKQLEAATSQPEPEPAPWPPEAPELDEEQFKVSEERLRKAIQVELPPDPPEPSVAEIPPLPDYSAIFSQFTPFQNSLPSPHDLGVWLAAQSEQLSQMSVLQSQAGVHQERIQEMRDTHKLEVESLNSELSNIRAEFSKQANELAGARQAFQEEEEKRQKSVNLLKAIRQKLTKAEQAKSEAEQERDKKANELITVKQQSESVINRIRTGFEREIVTLKGLHEKESAGKKSQAELELLTLKSIHSQELTSKRKRVEELEKHVAEMQSEKDDIFENGQQMETEVERARTWASDLESQLNEKSVQLQDALSQIESLQAEGVRTAVSQDGTSHNATVRQHQEALDALEKTYNAKVGALETQVSTLEASRSKAEAEMSATMESRLNEVERMRLDMRTNQSKLESVNAELQRWSDKANELERDAAELRLRNVGLEKSLETNQAESTRFNDCIDAVREELSDAQQRVTELEARLDESHLKESQLRLSNKAVRDELRKIQSGVLVSDKARNPGVGYFASYGQQTPKQDGSLSSTPDVTSPNMSATSAPLSRLGKDASSESLSLNEANASGSANNKEDEAINFEYLRNVIMQFLENKEMRPHLVTVLGVILHFTPQELRRVSSKVNS